MYIKELHTKYYLIYKYHDTYVEEYHNLTNLYENLKLLHERYENDNDFSYKVIYGVTINDYNLIGGRKQ